MKALNFVLRAAGLLAGTALLTFNAGAAEADALPSFENNYIKFSASGTDLDGSNAAYQARTQQYKQGAVGIEDLRFTYDLAKDTNLQLDGRAIAGNEDYLLSFTVTKEEVGSFSVGYKTFRTFYDGAGGFFPIGNAWIPVFPREQYIDRGQFFVKGTIALPEKPVITFSFTSSTRDGIKNSTIWGDSNLTGIPVWAGPGAVNPIPATRKILPAMTDVDERTDAWEVGVKHKLGNTTAHVSIGGSMIDNVDTRVMVQNIGELTPFPATYTTLVQNNARAGSPRRTVVMYAQEQTAFHATAEFETVVSDKVTVFGGLLYHTADADIAASRLLTATLMTRNGIADYAGGFVNSGASARAPYHVTSSGTTQVDAITANLGARLQATPTLWIEAALRGERYEDSGTNAALYTAQGVTLATGAVTNYSSPGVHGVDNVEKPWTPTLDVRYTGIKNVALYGSWEYRTTKQNEFMRYEGFDGAAKVTSLDFIGKDIKESHSNAKVGANVTLTQMLGLRAELFSKDHENDFVGYADVLGRDYSLNYDVYGAKLTATLKPANTLTLTSRYILQKGKAAVYHSGLATTGGAINGWVDGNDSTRHTFGQSITWNPTRNVYVQANGTIVYDQIVTMNPWISGVAKRSLLNSDNNYQTADVTIGFAFDKKTDVRLQGSYYNADNFNVAYAPVGMPYGASARDVAVSAGFRRKISDKTVLGAKLGYVDSQNDTLGGFADFKGPVGYLTVEHAF